MKTADTILANMNDTIMGSWMRGESDSKCKSSGLAVVRREVKALVRQGDEEALNVVRALYVSLGEMMGPEFMIRAYHELCGKMMNKAA